jgi:PLP dependent protein
MIDLTQPIENTKKIITQTASQAHRDPKEITLVAVSKTKPVEDILKAYHAGLRDFGENRAEELERKAQALAYLTDIRWHFIGHLQSRQIKPVAEYAHCFHAVDRLKIAEKLSLQLDHQLPVFIEVNLSGEETKDGFDLKMWETSEQQRQLFLETIQQINLLKNIKIIGLMTMAPWQASETTIRLIFRRLKNLLIWLNAQSSEWQFSELSMGMSGDFEIAIEEGATFVRIGSAIFGER